MQESPYTPQEIWPELEKDLAVDKAHIWHPYTAMHKSLPVYPVAGASGVRLKLADGRELVDGMSSWWTAIHGYQHPRLDAAAKAQLGQMAHVMFGGITHQPAIRLTRKLLELAPSDMEHVFFSDSGSVSVEVAIKMSIQYWAAQDKPEKHQLLTIRGGYHGDTFEAMSVCDPVNGMHGLFRNVLPIHHFASRPSIAFDQPWNPLDVQPFKEIIQRHHQDLAAVILEPIVQGAGGMWFYHPSYLRTVRRLCEEYDVLLILDEIATGFGRTGKLFACEHADIQPDIMCVGKALTGGYMSLAATLCSPKVANGMAADSQTHGVFMHGPTFMGNPLACSIAAESLQLLTEMDWEHSIRDIEAGLLTGLKPLDTHPAVSNVRVLGGIGVVEMKEAVEMARWQAAFVKAGVWVRPFGKLVYVMPPYIISNADLEFLTQSIRSVVTQLA